MTMKFLRDLMDRAVPVRVFVSNGFQLKGRIVDADDRALLIEADGKRKLVLLQAVTTIEPM